jgi:hypothetical protein
MCAEKSLDANKNRRATKNHDAIKSRDVMAVIHVSRLMKWFGLNEMVWPRSDL